MPYFGYIFNILLLGATPPPPPPPPSPVPRWKYYHNIQSIHTLHIQTQNIYRIQNTTSYTRTVIMDCVGLYQGILAILGTMYFLWIWMYWTRTCTRYNIIGWFLYIHIIFEGLETFENDFRVLVAGGGTGLGLVVLGEQLNHTNAEVGPWWRGWFMFKIICA